MCVVSMVGDSYRKRLPEQYPWALPVSPNFPGATPLIPASKTEVDNLRKEVEELKKLIKAAKLIDEKTGQKDCQHDDKFELLKKIAEKVGVDLGV